MLKSLTSRKISNIFFLSFFAVSILFLASGCENCEEIEPTPAIVEAGFENDADGWTIVGDAQGGSNLEASYSPFDGLDNSGYIFAQDNVAGGVWYFSAPQKLLGDLSRYFEGSMTFWLIQESNRSNQFEDEDIILEGNGNRIYYKYESPTEFPDTTWTRYSVKLDETANWFKESGEAASNADITNVLSNVTNLYIRGEFEGGPDTGGLDQFELR